MLNIVWTIVRYSLLLALKNLRCVQRPFWSENMETCWRLWKCLFLAVHRCSPGVWILHTWKQVRRITCFHLTSSFKDLRPKESEHKCQIQSWNQPRPQLKPDRISRRSRHVSVTQDKSGLVTSLTLVYDWAWAQRLEVRVRRRLFTGRRCRVAHEWETI